LRPRGDLDPLPSWKALQTAPRARAQTGRTQKNPAVSARSWLWSEPLNPIHPASHTIRHSEHRVASSHILQSTSNAFSQQPVPASVIYTLEILASQLKKPQSLCCPRIRCLHPRNLGVWPRLRHLGGRTYSPLVHQPAETRSRPLREPSITSGVEYAGLKYLLYA
jgi:hypothetical protein